MAECILGSQRLVFAISQMYNANRDEISIRPPLSPDHSSPLPALATMAIPTFISQYPGVLWLLFSLPRIVAPAFLVYAFISSSLGLLVDWDSLDSSRWKVGVVSALTFPSAFFCSITWNRLKIAHRARRLGATTPPVIAGSLPGSLDLAWLAAKNRFTAYPGEQTLAGIPSCQGGCRVLYCRAAIARRLF